MIKHWSIYRLNDGLFTGEQIGASIPDHQLINTSEGCAVVEGRHDWLSKRMDLATGQVVEYQPPAPSTDHAWNDETKRWAVKPEIAAAQARRQAALAQIATLEASQHRMMRELLIDPNDAAAKQRLLDVDKQIGALRVACA